jgi:Flp pilus assembly protein TadD/NAD-dependent dihydropyrimidine dehydrogenase PreA subunit
MANPIDFGDPALPVAGQGSLSSIRKSRRAKWRAAVLIGVHVAIAAHATHYLLAGRTLSPVEPSESMYTLELGYVNAGFVFFAVALLGTLLFGRFFCGWGCHIVALQDFCGWLMKKAGIRPRPFRSRLLMWVPLVAGLYMFVWPSFKRWVGIGRVAEFPGWSNQLATDSFWATFPGPVFAALTLATCGFAAVYFLGAKGFCSYGCPYGGFFVELDRFSIGSIVVNDDCEGCGHCTATCTSNVLVHEEVRLFGKVVDPGCMKCMDCVDVCPKNALSFGWARPRWLTKTRGVRRARRYDLPWYEELLLLLVFAVGVLAFRGLYDGPPLLMTLGLAAITAFLALKAVHVVSRPTVRVQNLVLKLGGRLEGLGRVFVGFALLWLVFTAHSAFVQAHRLAGRHQMERTQAARADVLSGNFRNRWYPEEHYAAAAASFRHFRAADRWGLIRVPEVDLGLAWGHLLRDEVDPAVERIGTVLEGRPDDVQMRNELAQVLLTRGRIDEAVAVKQQGFALGQGSDVERIAFGTLLAQGGHAAAAIDVFLAAIADGIEGLELRFNLGGLLRREGRVDEAVTQLAAAAALDPQDSDTQVELGLALQSAGRSDEAVGHFERALELSADRPEVVEHLRGLIESARLN